MSQVKLTADSGGGTTSLKAPSSTTSNADVVLKLPVADGSANQVLKTDGSGQLSFTSNAGTTINNNADNRIITGSGTASTLNGESNLTFDGTTFQTSHATGAIGRIQNTTAAAGQIATLELGPANGLLGTALKSHSEEDFSTGANRTAFFTISNRKDGTLSENMRIDSSGRLLLGTSTASSAGNSQYSKFEVSGNTSGATGPGHLTIKRGTASASTSNGDTIGRLIFSGLDGGDFAFIQASVDADTTTDFPGRLMFYTCADGATSATERMRIDSNGRVKVNATSYVSTAVAEQFASDAGNGGGYAGVFASNTSGGYASIYCKTGTNVSNFAFFYRDTSLVGSITTNGSSVSYNTSSDYRLKENAVAISDGITRLKTLKPYRFNWKADPSTTVDGFFAHEVTAVPEAVTGTKDEVSTEEDGATPKGEPIYQSIDQSKLVPLLTAALQEAIAKIEVLETKVAALEAA